MIIWGFRSRNKVLGQAPYTCQQCRREGFHTIVRSRRWFTLFFIPLFPFTKTSTSRCNLCGVQTRIQNAQAEAFFVQQPQAQPVPVQPAQAQGQVQAGAPGTGYPAYPSQPPIYQTDPSSQQ
jgi:hypothetical protein